MSRLRLSSRRRPRQRVNPLIACYLQGADGGLIVQTHPSPAPPRIGIAVLGGAPLRLFDLVEADGERATYQEVEGRPAL